MKVKITLDGYRCQRCGHEWVPRNKAETPIHCPRCKSGYWNRPRRIKKVPFDDWAKAGQVVLNLAGLIASVRVVVRVLHLSTPHAVTAVSIMLLTHGMFQQWVLGHFIGLLLFPMTQAWAAYRDGRLVAAGLWLAPAVAVKPPLAILALALPWHTWAAAGFASASVSLLMIGITGWQPWAAWWQAGTDVWWLSLPFNASLWGMAARWQLGSNGAARLTDIDPLMMVAVLGIGTVGWIAAVAQRDPDRRFLCAGLLSVLLSPLGWGYYMPLVFGAAVAAWPGSILAWCALALTLSPVGANPSGLGLLPSSATFAAVVCGWIAWTAQPKRAPAPMQIFTKRTT